MSNAGQAALGIVGGIIGFYVGGPTGAAYGFQLGLAVGTIVSPTQLPGTYGPRLTDNRTTTSQLGAPVTEVFGTDAVPGVVIWLGDIVESATTEEVGGKGAPEGEQTTYHYNQPIAIGLCRGPMGGLIRIWENGKLVYDIREQVTDEDDDAFANRLTASAAYALTFALYLGDEDQLPDPTIELKEGVGNVPAFRGLMYIVYESRELRDDQARRHPNFKFEVFSEGQLTCAELSAYAPARIYRWADTVDPRNALNAHTYRCIVNNAYSGGVFASLELAIAHGEGVMGKQFPYFQGYSTSSDSGKTTLQTPGPAFDRVADESVFFHYTSEPCEASINDNNVPGSCGTNASYFASVGITKHFTGNTNESFALTSYPEPTSPTVPPGYDVIRDCGGGGFDYAQSWSCVIDIRRVESAPLNPCDQFGESAQYPGFAFDTTTGLLTQCTDWEEVIVPGVTGLVLADALNAPGTPLPITSTYSASQPLIVDPGLRDDDANNTEVFWAAAYEAARDAGLLPAGWIYGTDYPAQHTIYSRTGDACTVDTSGVPIAVIVEAICNRCGLVDVDVSDLEDRYVLGYQITRVMDGRSAIAPLRSVGFFDAVESGMTIKFPVRGKATVRTLDIEDLSAHAFDSDTPPAVTTKTTQDVELPRTLFVNYRDPARDYENGEQPSPNRLTTDAVNDLYVDVAAAIDATTAAQCAEVLWSDMWAARWRHQISLDCSHSDLEPTDCVLIPVDGRLERVRLVDAQDSAVILRQFQAVRDDDGSYVSAAIADPPAVTPAQMVIYSLTNLLLLDLPPLRVADNDVGLYAAARPASSGLTWSGVQIFRASDGITFAAVASIVNHATTGTLDAAFAAGETTVWDDVTEIFVTLEPGRTLESRTDDDVLAGANSAAIGVNGRWEIVQFANAELIGVDEWKLTRLLRGRRGTEHYMGTQIDGDLFVLISGPGIIRLPLDNALLDVDTTYKAVTFGTSYATGVDQVYASHGEALTPFSPVSIAGEVESSGDLLITWIRRSRWGSELPDGDDIALSDPPESYTIDIYSADSPVALLRTLTSSTTEVTYTDAMQTTDGDPITIVVEVRAINAVVGVGTSGTAIIEVS